MLKKICIATCLYIIFGIIEIRLIPQNWKYIFGVIVGIIVTNIFSNIN